MSSCRPLVLLPPIFSVCTAAGLWIVYFVALYNKKVLPLSDTYRHRNGSAYSPYISITGNFPPASCIFSQVMNLAAFAGFVMGILRYIQLKNRLDKPWLNIVSVASFSIACFGMTIVGNFQLFELGLIHDVGTLMTFGLGTLYCWMQSYITLRVNLKNEGRAVAISRFLLSAAITLCIILKQALVVIPHMHSVRCQWALVMFFLIFMGTFAIEFRHCRFDVVCRDAVEHQSWPEASGQRQELQESHTVLYLNTLSSDLHRTS
ncbi:transmembrane protein 150C isoform X3 [Girardinichthys multiradiatus]|nr:transmembrane protein 150C isoform X3 [Girardinichthys multiradiatus]